MNRGWTIEVGQKVLEQALSEAAREVSVNKKTPKKSH